MKSILAIGLLAIVSCNNSDKKESAGMTGVYTMLSQSVNDGKKDTTYTNLKQLKIYTADHMMYANVNPADSVSSFGIGTYTASGDTVTENVVYNASDTSANSTAASFTLLIEKTAKGYKQVIPEIKMGDQKLKLTEEYETSGSATTAALDGAWKQIKGYNIKGKDTVPNTTIQYKTYYGGYFMFGHTYTDSVKKVHTGMGYGTFAMNGTNKVKENVTASTYSQIRGKSFDIDIEMNGSDEFKQTITDTDGTKAIEIYQRLKK
ncbi:hypothetical protein [Ferruginibacter sp. SUN106]|uniref:hypothetical protein n=1 Tax=Ferruginibacter sp. SUN106 TaxID=2978348 RepID=UPI003D3662D1